MSIPEGAPPREHYTFVLLRTDWEPIESYWFYAYDETCTSRKIRWHGRDVHAMFPLKQTTRDRLLWTGWRDVSDEYLRDPHLFEIPNDEPVPADVAKTADRSMASWKDRILTAIATRGPTLSKSQIMEATGIPDQLYRDLMPVLVQDEAIRAVGTGPQTVYELVV